MPNFKDHSIVLEKLKEAQDFDHDNRERAREAYLFVNKRDGQWEPFFWNANSGRPRYSFDMTSAVIDQVAGLNEQLSYSIVVDPAGGEATTKLARTADGLIRNIENMSNAKHIYNQAGRAMITAGLDGWRVVSKFVDDNSFDQDLAIEKINNFQDRVWFDPGSELQDRSDANWCFVLQALTLDDYKERFPKGSEMSVSEDRRSVAYFHKDDKIIVGEFLFKREVSRDLIMLTNGQVVEDNDDFAKIRDELAQSGITEIQRRKRKFNKIISRMFDGGDWLGKEKETVFGWLPVVPTYGNYSIFENKVIYYGVVEKLTDYQRCFNYAKSKEIEEVALSPRPKWWMTTLQGSGFEDTLSTLNTNHDPVQFFNPDPELPGPPQQTGGSTINPGLLQMSQSMQEGMARAAGLFAASMGEEVTNQSGVAIRQLQRKGNVGTTKYIQSQEIAICHTGRILLDAIPKIYDTERQVRILGQDGQASVTTLNQAVVDTQTGDVVMLNDLSQGKYDLTCIAGPTFSSQQEETVASIIEMAQVDPTIIQTGGDILLQNVTTPGMNLLAERKRQQLLQEGLIPESQLTQEEQAAIQQAQEAAAQQPPQPDPSQMIAQAELIKAQVLQESAQVDVQEKSANIQLKQQEQQRKQTETDARIANQQELTQVQLIEQQNEQQRVDIAAQKQQSNEILARIKQDGEERKLLTDQLMAGINAIKTQAETLKIIREAMGVDAIVGPHNQAAYINQAKELNEAITEDDQEPVAKVREESEEVNL